MRIVRKSKPKNTLSRLAEKRRGAIMEAAWDLFMEKGYAAVSVDAIVKKAGGSKATVYELFGSKEGLFYAIINESTGKILADMTLPDTEGMSIRAAIWKIGYAITRGVLSYKCTGLFWLSVSVSRRFPDVAHKFYEGGPLKVRRAFADFLSKETRAGRLRVKNPAWASDIFHGMLLEYNHMEMALGYRKAPSDKEVRRLVDEAVDAFMSLYGTGKKG